MHSVPIGMPVAVITSNPFDEEVHVITSDGCLCHFLGQGRTTLPNSGRAAPRLTNVLGGQGRGKFKIHLRVAQSPIFPTTRGYYMYYGGACTLL